MLSKTQINSLVKHIRSIADILESNKVVENGSVKSKRGRKPGAVADEFRCKAELSSSDRCKNRATKGEFCGKHEKVEQPS